MSSLRATAKWFNNMETMLCELLLACFVVLLFAQIIARQVFQYSIAWSEELSTYMFVWFAYLGAVVEYSTDLSEGSWTTFGGTSVQANTPGPGLDTMTATLPASLAGPGGKVFARLKVETP